MTAPTLKAALSDVMTLAPVSAKAAARITSTPKSSSPKPTPTSDDPVSASHQWCPNASAHAPPATSTEPPISAGFGLRR